MQRKTGVLIFTHGSRLQTGNEAMLRLVEQLQHRFGSDLIEPCFMELGKPPIPAAIKRLIAKGCNHIFGYALFLVPGSHLQEDIPFIFEQTLKKYPGVTFEISPPLLSDPLLIDFVAKHLDPVLAVPVTTSDAVNARILAVSEDQLQGFQRDPLGEIARQSGVELLIVVQRIQAMLRAGTIRRVRQTLLATNLAQGSLVAWQVPEDKLNAAFDYMFQRDPFSGHVVIRTTDTASAAARYRLWTTLKVPQGFSLAKHCEYLASQTGATKFVLLPAKKLFALGVGHVRRRGLEPGSRAEVPADVTDVSLATLSDVEWRVLTALKREFSPEELSQNLWQARADEAGVPRDVFLTMAEDFNRRKIIGRFSTFLEHVKPVADGERVTRFNALFHWAVPASREIDAGREVGRHHIMTHAYWREGGPEFHNVNIMGVAHGTDKALLLAHKAAIDEHLAAAGIAVTYTNVFWGGRSEIKPSEISPLAYRAWCAECGLAVAKLTG